MQSDGNVLQRNIQLAILCEYGIGNLSSSIERDSLIHFFHIFFYPKRTGWFI